MMYVSLCFPICVGNDSAAANKIYLWVLIKELELELELILLYIQGYLNILKCPYFHLENSYTMTCNHIPLSDIAIRK